MAVPKKRTGHSAQGHRRSNWKATKPETTKCPNCGETVLTHTVCTACGTYKGKPVSIKDRVEEAAVKEEKKPAKKSTKKAEKAEETKVEEVKAEAVVEEAKEEAPVEETSETEEK
ncbi:50S ribosomal protein L32 [Fusobacterium sp. CAG:439]|nr:50S ribosomal protein L32 [Fusobacterium sp. CAG:439]HIT91538.1 50S ribosomal protein L32 [Candidatus Stercorousia faecigallinarum]